MFARLSFRVLRTVRRIQRRVPAPYLVAGGSFVSAVGLALCSGPFRRALLCEKSNINNNNSSSSSSSSSSVFAASTAAFRVNGSDDFGSNVVVHPESNKDHAKRDGGASTTTTTSNEGGGGEGSTSTKRKKRRHTPLRLSFRVGGLGLVGFLRLGARAIQLAWIFFPCAMTSVVALFSTKWRGWWLEHVVSAMERAGPTFIKFGQWASTRPDMFPPMFCKKLKRLQSSVAPHTLTHTDEMFQEAFGCSISDVFEEFNPHPVGSGCVAQVYRAKLKPEFAEGAKKGRYDDQDEEYEGRSFGFFRTKQAAGHGDTVAIKVLHPGVAMLIERDLSLVYLVARVLTAIPTAKWLSLKETVEEFSVHMERQLDLVREAQSLDHFRADFENDSNISFPMPLWPLVSQGILVETFCEGQTVQKFLAEHRVADNQKIAAMGLDAFLKMMLRNNFVHADLHPGNLLVRGKDPANLQIVFLDAGLTCELSPNDRKNFLALFSALLKGDGRLGASLMVQNARENECTELEKFQEEMQSIFDQVRSKNLQELDIGMCLAQVLEMVRQYRVKIESNFATLITAIIVAEGLGRKLDPEVSIFRRAMKFAISDSDLRAIAWQGLSARGG